MLKTTAQFWDAKRFRLIGALPIIIFIARLIQYIQIRRPKIRGSFRRKVFEPLVGE